MIRPALLVIAAALPLGADRNQPAGSPVAVAGGQRAGNDGFLQIGIRLLLAGPAVTPELLFRVNGLLPKWIQISLQPIYTRRHAGVVRLDALSIKGISEPAVHAAGRAGTRSRLWRPGRAQDRGRRKICAARGFIDLKFGKPHVPLRRLLTFD